ncbi:hypothetical protein [Draconibacterium sediminis]|uniref:hypothetical protein n=1 Tax=Draconibacterium sediminis TaxID=1544798 RepID=UPI0026EF22D0|nr:hypothetical protein [Draconibacterium sediminis]
MKKPLLLTILTFVSLLTLQAQNVDKEKISYTYLRNPIEKLDASIKKYNVEVDILWIQREQNKLAEYEMELAKAEEEYQAEMETYNNKSLGKVLAERALIGEGKKPEKRFVKKPETLAIPELSILESKIALDGYDKGTDDAILIKVTYKEIACSAPIDAPKEKNGESYKLRKVKVQQPVEVSLITSDGNVLYTEVIKKSNYEHEILAPQGIKDSEWDKYVENTWPAYFNSQLSAYLESLATEVNELINYKFGYSNVKRYTELYKGDGKKYSYDSHLLTLRKAQRAYEGLLTDSQESVNQLKESIAEWSEEIKEADPSDKKARINSEVQQALLINIIEAYVMTGNYNEATDICDKIELMPDAKKKYLKDVENLRDFIKDEKLRNS